MVTVSDRTNGPHMGHRKNIKALLTLSDDKEALKDQSKMSLILVPTRKLLLEHHLPPATVNFDL